LHGVRITLFGAAYAIVGVATASFAGSAPAIQGRNAWRLAAWALSLVLFGAQLLIERVRSNKTAAMSALHASLAVALGALLLAAAGPVRSHWGTDTQTRALLSLVLWPLLTGVASFVAAFAFGSLLRRPGADEAR
jgi:hypothetical protein